MTPVFEVWVDYSVSQCINIQAESEDRALEIARENIDDFLGDVLNGSYEVSEITDVTEDVDDDVLITWVDDPETGKNLAG